MPLPVIAGLALSVASEFLPSAVGWITGSDKAEAVSETVVNLARSATGAGPEDDLVARLRANPEAVIKLQTLWTSAELELYREGTKRLEAVNETMRAELVAGDKYVRRWRPTFGYVAAITWGVQGLVIFGCLAWIILKSPENLAAALTGIKEVVEALSSHWLYAMAVLGVAVAARSGDKRQKAAGDGVVSSPGALARSLSGLGAAFRKITGG